MSSPRVYRSPLRADQMERTRTLILDTLAEMVAEDGFDGIVVRDLAARAGIAERTVYRHFPDRDALHDALCDRVVERAGWGGGEPYFSRLEDMPQMAESLFRSFDDDAVAIAVGAKLNLVRGRMGPDSVRRTERIRASLQTALPDATDPEIDTLLVVMRMLGSSRNWLRLRDEFGLPGASSAPIIRWLLDLVVADVVARGGHVPEQFSAAPDPDVGGPGGRSRGGSGDTAGDSARPSARSADPSTGQPKP